MSYHIGLSLYEIISLQEYKTSGASQSLVHMVVEKGCGFAGVLKELLKVRLPDGSPAFNVNGHNTKGLTPLHLACERHIAGTCDETEVIKVLLDAGADIHDMVRSII